MKKKSILFAVIAVVVAAVLTLTIVLSVRNCGGNSDSTSAGESTKTSESTPDSVTPAVIKKGTYHTTTATMPSNWNELTYQDNNDVQILDYIRSGFFEYDYKFDDAKGGK